MNIAIKSDHKAIDDYHNRLKEARASKDTHHEGNIRHAFANLLETTARVKDWKLVQEFSTRAGGHTIRYDGVLRDGYDLPHGHWEAKDSDDNLDIEIRKKRDKKYSFENIIFEDSQEAILFQRGLEVVRTDVDDNDGLADLLTRFYGHEIAPFKDFDAAIQHFQDEIPHIAKNLNTKIKDAHKDNKAFKTAYGEFMEICKTALNPNISRDAVDEMLIQHMLTERLIRKVFNVEKFVRQNVIAREIEKVIDALTQHAFNRKDFLGNLDRFYTVIEKAAEELATFTEKQHFINTVYERFFQGYSVKIADTHGIVYTPQEIVDFMCAAVEEVLQDEFGASLGDEGVNILDPCTGTGNFMVNLLNRVPIRDLERVYREQLFANEVMLLPYYVAALNIEHAYYERSGKYEAFEGLSFVDTLDLADKQQMAFSFMTEANTERVEKQKKADINVIIGNPPYNVGQLNENDNNKNRAYEVIDKRVKDTYAKDSKATLKAQLYDAYVKFMRWAADRLGERDGIVCYVTNNGFVDGIAFDGMRKQLLQDFTRVYHLDLGGNLRKNQSGKSIGNVFNIMVGVGITVAVRSSNHKTDTVDGTDGIYAVRTDAADVAGELLYHRVPDFWTRAQKIAFLAEHVEKMGRHNALNTIEWTQLTPDKRNTWLVPEHAGEFDEFIPIGTKEAKRAKGLNAETIFKTYSNGVKTNRDAVVFDFDRQSLISRIQQFTEGYNAEVDRYKRSNRPSNVDEFVNYEKLKWSSTLKVHLKSGRYAQFDNNRTRISIYRPFAKQTLYYDSVIVDRPGGFPHIFPTTASEQENRVICVAGVGNRKGFGSLITNHMPAFDLAFEKAQCFPFYVYDEDGGNRRENITDWVLGQFRATYGGKVEKWDIFYYVYALLHHAGYRERYADNLKRELPRIPLVGDFRKFADAGRELADLHLNYEDVDGYRLKWVVEDEKAISYKVDKMRLMGKSKRSDEQTYHVYDAIEVNDTLTMEGIPAEAFDYRLGNRSALEWVVDQYRVKTDTRSGIVSDPNQYGDERYIVDLVEKVIAVSLATVAIVDELGKVDLL
jgi:predicted helicase